MSDIAVAVNQTVTAEQGVNLAVPVTSMAKYTSDEAFAALAKAADYLPRFQLYGSNSKACKQGLIPIAHYGYASGDDITDVGPEVRAYVLSVRLKAMRITGDKVETVFNPEHPEFKKIKIESGEKDTGSLCGPEFLLYLPEVGKFVTFFMANKTMRREAPNVKEYMPTAANPNARPMTLRATLIEKGEYMWHGPVVSGCSIPLTPPDPEVMMTELTKFNNPPEPKGTTATEADKAATARAR
jgi:hypothetical protein